jgi:hypothetical protein
VGLQLGRLGPFDRSASLLVGRTHLSGTAMSPVGGDPGVPMSHSDPKELRATTSCDNVLYLGNGLSNTRLFA